MNIEQQYEGANQRQLTLIKDAVEQVERSVTNNRDSKSLKSLMVKINTLTIYDPITISSLFSSFNAKINIAVYFKDGGIKDYETAKQKGFRQNLETLNDINRIAILPVLPKLGNKISASFALDKENSIIKKDWSIEKYSGIITHSVRRKMNNTLCQCHIGNPKIFEYSNLVTHKFHEFVRTSVASQEPKDFNDNKVQYYSLVSSSNTGFLDLAAPTNNVEIFENIKDIQTFYHAKAIKESNMQWHVLYKKCVEDYNQMALQRGKPLINERIVNSVIN